SVAAATGLPIQRVSLGTATLPSIEVGQQHLALLSTSLAIPALHDDLVFPARWPPVSDRLLEQALRFRRLVALDERLGKHWHHQMQPLILLNVAALDHVPHAPELLLGFLDLATPENAACQFAEADHQAPRQCQFERSSGTGLEALLPDAAN